MLYRKLGSGAGASQHRAVGGPQHDVRRRARREGACAACAARRARRARHGERGLRLGLRRQQSLGWPSMVHSIGQGARPVRPDRRDRPDRVEHVPIPPAASTARLDPFGCRRAPAAQELPRASAAEQGALVGIGARAAGSEGSGRSRAPE